MKNKLYLKTALLLLTIFTCENAMSQENVTTKQYIKVEYNTNNYHFNKNSATIFCDSTCLCFKSRFLI